MKYLEKVPLINHLDELRVRILFVIIFISTFFLIGIFFSAKILNVIIKDLSLSNVEIIVTTPLEFILSQLKVAFLFAIIISFPILLYHVILFIKPALKRKEKNSLLLILPSSVLLFIIGILFAYFIFLKIALYYLASLAIGTAQNLWTLNKIISFIFTTSLSFGIIFELPLLMLLLKKLNIISISMMKRNRKIVYIILMIIAAIITPADILTMILLVVPLIILYEFSLIVIKFF